MDLAPMEVTQLQRQGGLSTTARRTASSTAAGEQRSRRPARELQSLPIARDSHGRSPLQYSSYALSLHEQSPRLMAGGRPATPKPSSPAALLLESLAPAKNWASPLQEKAKVSHLERCSSLQPSNSKTTTSMEALKMWTSHDALIQAVRGSSSMNVACSDGSPTARALRRAFPESNATMFAQPEAALSALERRQVQRALLPVESSTRGSVHRTYDLLLRHSSVHIVGELVQQMQLLHSRPAAVDDNGEEARNTGAFGCSRGMQL
ncbi:hypothetical protein L7F22_035957 [Adiantum nelumboides]|nr:hypothetical protein [Adiantum nelumboides]